MPSHTELFNELLIRLKTSDRFAAMGGEPVYYLIFRAQEMLEIKKNMKVLISRLAIDGWSPKRALHGDVVNEILRNDSDRAILLESEKSYLEEGDIGSINESLRSILIGSGLDKVTRRILDTMETVRNQNKPILLISDIEALHPYLRIGAIEQKLQGRCPIPVVIFYPGNRTGSSSLQFLGIWPDDGNYRSTHIG